MRNMGKFEGVIPPLLTPFTKTGEVHEEGLRKLIDFQAEKGVHGLYICGTYGSGPAMSKEQRKKVAEITMDSVKGRMFVIVHVGASSVDDAIDLAKHAEDVGADAVASVPPFYYALEDEAIIEYYRKLVSKVNIPVFVYDNPARTGVRLNVELIKKLSEEGVAGIKDSSFDLVKFYEEVVTVSKEGFVFIIGTEALALPALLAGAKGIVSGLANAFPELVLELYKSTNEGKLKEASELQLKVIKARKALHLAPVIPVLYELLRIRGIDAGYPKVPPFRLVKTSELERVRKEFVELGLLK